MRAQAYAANAKTAALTFQVLYVFYLEARRLRRFCELSNRVTSEFLGENDSTLSPGEILASTRQTIQPLATGCQPEVARLLQERLAKCETNTEVLRCVHRFLRDQEYGPRQYLQATLRPRPLGRVDGMPGRRSPSAFRPCIPGMTRNGYPSKNKKNGSMVLDDAGPPPVLYINLDRALTRRRNVEQQIAQALPTARARRIESGPFFLRRPAAGGGREPHGGGPDGSRLPVRPAAAQTWTFSVRARPHGKLGRSGQGVVMTPRPV